MKEQTMKNVLFALIFMLFTGCMSDRERYEKEFTDGCLRNYPLQEKEAQKACECFAKLMTSRFSDEELSIALKKYHTPQERQLISQKMNYIEREVWGNKQAFEGYIRECMQDNKIAKRKEMKKVLLILFGIFAVAYWYLKYDISKNKASVVIEKSISTQDKQYEQNINSLIQTPPKEIEKIETKEIETPNLETLKQKCEKDDGASCAELSIIYYDGKFVSQDIEQAGNFGLKACKLKNGKGCNLVGILFIEYGNEGSEEFLLGFDLYKTACELDYASGCLNLAIHLYTGKYIPKDYSKAIKLYEKACDLGEGLACSNLGLIYANGLGCGLLSAIDKNEICIKKDYAKAIELYERGCDLKEGESCLNLSTLYDKGEGVVKNPFKAFEIDKKGCEFNHGGCCRNAALSYHYGKGASIDYTKAFELYKKACDLNDDVGCNNVGGMYYVGLSVNKNIQKAAEFYKKACELGNTEACINKKQLE